MKILFIHQNFPGQFKHLAPALVRQGHEVHATVLSRVTTTQWQGVRLHGYSPTRGSTPGIHPWCVDMETKLIRAQALTECLLHLKQQGWCPNVIIAHPGWGEALFLHRVWPGVPVGMYCEFFYPLTGGDADFDSEFDAPEPLDDCRLEFKNAQQRLQLEHMHAGLSPTHWQASTYPRAYRARIQVVHDGIDTGTLRPNPAAVFTATNDRGQVVTFVRGQPLLTFVNRSLEPYRGYHVFMRALPDVLREHPQVQCVIVGAEGVSYGAAPKEGSSWKQRLIEEIQPRMTDEMWQRVHFLGSVPYSTFIELLQVSMVHVYLTYPFVLSWSVLEAMGCGCAIVASDTAPVREAIVHGLTGRLVDFFDPGALAQEVLSLLSNGAERARLGAAARAHAQANYDLNTHCLPVQLAWVARLGETTTN